MNDPQLYNSLEPIVRIIVIGAKFQLLMSAAWLLAMLALLSEYFAEVDASSAEECVTS